MQSLTSKEFIEKLKTGSLEPAFMLKGLVKKSDKDSEILFAKKPNFKHWVKLPTSMIESAVVLKNFTCKEGETHSFVKLLLKAPTNPETKALYELLTSSCEEKEGEGRCGGIQGGKGIFFGQGMHGGCHCGCQGHGMQEHGYCQGQYEHHC